MAGEDGSPSETCDSDHIFVQPSSGSTKHESWTADQRMKALCPTKGATVGEGEA